MRERFLKELNELNFLLYKFCSKVVMQVEDSVTALILDDAKLAEKVKEEEKIVDEMQRDIERRCMLILLKEQPVASDFRRLSCLSKITTDLERIGDHAEDIALLSLDIHSEDIRKLDVLAKMCHIAQDMLTKTIDGFINNDFDEVKKVPEMDDELDRLFEEIKKQLARLLHKDFCQCEDIIILLMIAKYLERIGDHAVNISRGVLYLEGKSKTY